MANYTDEENFAFSGKGEDAFNQFQQSQNQNQNGQPQVQNGQPQAQNGQPQVQNGQQHPCNLKTNKKNEKEKKKHPIIVLTGIIIAAGLATPFITKGIIRAIQERNAKIDIVTEHIHETDGRNGDLTKMFDARSTFAEMFKGDYYKDLYESYARALLIAQNSDRINRLDCGHDIVVRDDKECIDCFAPDYEQQCEDLIKDYWKYKNTREAQTPGTKEYAEFQGICNKLLNTCNSGLAYVDSNEVKSILWNMYATCQAGKCACESLDRNGASFDASQIQNVSIQNNGKDFEVLFDYKGNTYSYKLEKDAVNEMYDVLTGTSDVLSGFGIVNNILIDNQNIQSSNAILYEDQSIRVRRG